MKKMKQNSLYHKLFMAATFAMVMIFAGLIGTMDVHAYAPSGDARCTVTIGTVTDKNSGKDITEIASVVFQSYSRIDGDYPVYDEGITQNENGTYTVPYNSEYGTNYRYYIVAPGYHDNRTNDKYNPIFRGAKLEVSGSAITLPDVALEPFTPTERLTTAINDASLEINNYLDISKYDPVEQNQISKIILAYNTRVENEIKVDAGNETEESANAKIKNLNNITSDTKKQLDGVTTSQSKTNEQYVNLISFIPAEEGEDPISLERTEYGKFKITLSMFDKGGKFNVTHDDGTTVTWNAIMKMIDSGGVENKVEYIVNNESLGEKGTFLSQKALPANSSSFKVGTISEASVKFTSGDKQVTFTFDLEVVWRKIEGIEYKGPTSVVLTRDKDGYFDTVLEKGTEENQYSLAVKSDDPTYQPDLTDVEIVSLTPSIADLNKKDTIIPKKTGTATFKAESDSFGECEFKIEFVLSKEEQNEITDAKEVDDLIAKLGDITLAKESEVQKARDAYDELSDGAKKKVSKLDVLTAAEKKIVTLKAQESEKKAQESEKKAQESEKKAQEAENKAQESEKQAQESEKKAQEAESKAQESEKKVTALQEQAIKQQLTKITLKATAGKKKVKLTWKKNAKATGYVIYRATKKNGTYKKIKVIKTWKTSSFTDKKLKSGKKYYYKIRAYKGSTNGTLSNAKSVKVK